MKEVIPIGAQFTGQCNQCQEQFPVREGGGFNFFLLHCDTCGQEKEVLEQEVREYMANKNDPLPVKQEVEIYAGQCHDGQFRLQAKARCPRCNSDDYRVAEGSEYIHYD